jgi:hypothetical protein
MKSAILVRVLPADPRMRFQHLLSGRDSNCDQACSNWREVARMVSSYTRISQTVVALKSALYTRGPLNVGMMVYSDFT